MLVVSAFVPQAREIFQSVQTAGYGSQRGFLQVFQCRMQRHCYVVTFLEIENYFGDLFQKASANTLSRGDPTLERNLHRENESTLVGCCAVSEHCFRTRNSDGDAWRRH